MKDRTRLYFKIRVCMVFIFFIVCLSYIAVHSYQIQALEREKYLPVAKKQYYGRRISLAPHRGTIYDAKGRELAVSMRVNSLFAEPAKIKNRRDVAARLAPILHRDAQDIYKLLSNPKSFVWLQRKINPFQQERIKALNLRGLGFFPESKRFYPNFELGAHVTGFAGMDSQGLEGLELKYEKDLKTANQYVVLEKDALERWIYIPEGEKGLKSPHNLHLTLDLRVQYLAERELKKGIADCKARGGMVLIMEPATGKILAMAVQPSFNPNLFEEYTPARWRNRAITDLFEPGSLMKVFLLAAVLQEEVAKENDIIFCENGAYTIKKHTIHDMSPHGWLTVKDVIRVSSNIGSLKIGKELGANRFYHHLEAFGFTQKTGVDLQGENAGEVRPPATWSPIDLAIISFGQGVSVTALELITAFCSIANGGTMMKPYLIERITDGRGKDVVVFSPEVRRRVLSEETSHRVTAVLKEVVRTGTGTRARISGYAVAGKTATAQKIDPVTDGYSTEKVTASFMGYLPADDPRVAILVVMDEPKTHPYGGVAATPIFQGIAEELMQYMGIPPTEGDFAKNIILTKTRPPKKHRADQQQFARHRMPDLRGLSMRQAIAQLEKEKVRITLAGSGILVNQRPEPGTALTEGCKVFLEFAPPL